MEGDGDPENRAPMRWDLVNDDNEVYVWTKQLIRLRKANRALKIGDYRKLISSQLIAFERFTDRVDDTVVVIANFSTEPVEELLMVPDSRLMNNTTFVDLLGSGSEFNLWSSILSVRLPARSALVLKPVTEPVDGYTPYKRID